MRPLPAKKDKAETALESPFYSDLKVLLNCDTCPYGAIAIRAEKPMVCAEYKEGGTCTDISVMQEFTANISDVEAGKKLLGLWTAVLIRKIKAGDPNVEDSLERLVELRLKMHEAIFGKLQLIKRETHTMGPRPITIQQLVEGEKSPQQVIDATFEDIKTLDLSPSSILKPIEEKGKRKEEDDAGEDESTD